MADNGDSLVSSTTVKTIRGLKVKKSYSKMPSECEGVPNSQDSTSVNPQTPPEANVSSSSKISIQRDENGESKTPESSHRKISTMSNSSRIRISTKKFTKPISDKVKSEIQIQDTDDQEEQNYIAFKSSQMINQNVNKSQNGRKLLVSETTEPEEFNPIGSQLQLRSSISNQELITNLQNRVVKEYKVIDIDYAIQYVLKRSKQVELIIENEGLFPTFIENSIINSKFFKISYDSFLQSEINKKNINEGFKNVSKRMLEKLEQFFVNRIQKCLNQARIQQTYVKNSKGIYNKLDSKIKELKNSLKEDYNLKKEE